MREIIGFYVIIFLLFLTGCANPINRYTAAKYYEMGSLAESRGDLLAARESYRRAMLNTEWGMLGPGPKAYTLYEYGRVSGYLCDQAEAEFSLKESLRLQDKDKEVRKKLRPPTLLELARFYYDTGRKAEALPYYEEGIALVRKLDVAKTDPIAFALTLEEFADSLIAGERQIDAENVKEEARILRTNYKGPEIDQPFQRYNDRCPDIKQVRVKEGV